ncbi:Uncharacterised protein [uncultured archaeon]|nr:Uncharacterised protein [uncultured archaeon]
MATWLEWRLGQWIDYNNQKIVDRLVNGMRYFMSVNGMIDTKFEKSQSNRNSSNYRPTSTKNLPFSAPTLSRNVFERQKGEKTATKVNVNFARNFSVMKEENYFSNASKGAR